MYLNLKNRSLQIKVYKHNIFKVHAKSEILIIPKIIKESFTIKHTAKEVEYNINGFRQKNKDELPKNIETTILNSKNNFIVEIWKVYVAELAQMDDDFA